MSPRPFRLLSIHRATLPAYLEAKTLFTSSSFPFTLLRDAPVCQGVVVEESIAMVLSAHGTGGKWQSFSKERNRATKPICLQAKDGITGMRHWRLLRHTQRWSLVVEEVEGGLARNLSALQLLAISLGVDNHLSSVPSRQGGRGIESVESSV